MISFGAITTKPVKGVRRRTTAPVAFYLNGAMLCLIAAGYEFDGLSRPWWLFWKWGRWDERYLAAALLHDYLLTHSAMPKRKIDWLFLGALLESEVPALEAGLFWLGVRTRDPGGYGAGSRVVTP